MSPLTRERIGKVFLLQSYDYSVVVAGFLMRHAVARDCVGVPPRHALVFFGGTSVGSAPLPSRTSQALVVYYSEKIVYQSR